MANDNSHDATRIRLREVRENHIKILLKIECLF